MRHRLRTPTGLHPVAGVPYRWIVVNTVAETNFSSLHEVRCEATELRGVAKRSKRGVLGQHEIDMLQVVEGIPGTPHLLDVRDGSDPHFVVAKLPGETLFEAVRRTGPLRPNLLAAVAAQLATVLHQVNGRGVVHRDVKPGNVMIETRMVDGKVVPAATTTSLIDFGDAKRRGEETFTGDSLTGTPYIFPPEVLDNPPLDEKTDVFALAVTMYFAFIGALPMDHREHGVNLDTLTTQRNFGLPRQRGWSTNTLTDVIEACGSEDPRFRPTFAEIIPVLAEIAKDGPEYRAPHQSPRFSGSADLDVVLMNTDINTSKFSLV